LGGDDEAMFAEHVKAHGGHSPGDPDDDGPDVHEE
jgi:hypothetical protein